MQSAKPSRLKRARHEMPDFVQGALLERELMAAYRSRPPYQQNDYIGWITRAKRPETKEKRLAQMLNELEGGDKYMIMDYRSKRYE
ncbi:MAG: YdeI/OmpD-associated family protein [Chloroflexi bacterium]|nr:YdeI/OmpD-associated family protein [Chloroflexota bacterium]